MPRYTTSICGPTFRNMADRISNGYAANCVRIAKAFISADELRRLAELIARFAIGQGLILLMNVVTGLVTIRLLTVSEYGTYITGGVLIVVCAVAADMGLSQALTSLGSRVADEPRRLGALYGEALRLRTKMFGLMVPVLILLTELMIRSESIGFWRIVAIFVVVLGSGWFQTQSSLLKALLNVHHDADSLFRAGFAEATARILATSALLLFPNALTALLVNVGGLWISVGILKGRCDPLIHRSNERDVAARKNLIQFVVPLLPSLAFFLVQGQLSVFVLNVYGLRKEVAEIGALGRLGQVVSVLNMMNPFLVQPIFARVRSRKRFALGAATLSGVLLILTVLTSASTYYVPGAWLWLIGKNYSDLANELPIAVLTACLVLCGATLYTIVLSLGQTRGQSWTIPAGLAVQLIYIACNGVHGLVDALRLSLLPQVSFVGVQIILLFVGIKAWKYDDAGLNSG